MYFILIRTNMNVPEEIMKYGYYLLPISQTTVTFFIEVEGRFWTEMWAGSIYECGSSNECVPVHCQWCVCACVVVCEDRMPLWAYQTGCPWVQFSSVAQSCPTLRDPKDHSTPGLPVHHQLPEFTQTHVHWVGDAIQPSHPLPSPSPPALNACQHQGLFQWASSSH